MMAEVIEQRIKQDDGSFASKKYHKLELIGRGGFAKCYRGIDLQTQDIVAIKVVDKITLAKSRARQKLISEIKIHKSINHPYIVKFANVFQDQKSVYMILELCPHGTLGEMLRRRKQLTPAETRFYIKQLLLAIQYLHQNKIIHRDLKMGNIFLADNLDMKLGDFGLSTKLQHLDERKRTMAGTPNYIAPQILEGGSGHSYEVDVWSTGVICFALLVGRPPFETNEVKLTYTRIKNCEYHFPPSLRLPDQAKDLIRRVLVLDPKKRLTTMEMLDHPFLKAFIPDSLPLSAISEIPIFKEQKPFSLKKQKSLSKRQVLLESLNIQRPKENKNCEKGKSPQKNYESYFKESIYVSTFVDYSNKYGLGYSLDDGSCGVYFNDSTLLGAGPTHQHYFYVVNPSHSSETTFFTQEELPKDRNFTKKSLLFERFEMYLKEEAEDKENMCELKKKNNFIFVKQWLKTKHAIMFRLSNGIFQVDFFDKSQLLLSTVKKVILFRSKEGEKTIETLNDALHETNSQMSRRIKYTREILNSLKKGPREGPKEERK